MRDRSCKPPSQWNEGDSISEGIPSTLNEAMTAGHPVMSTRVVGTSEAVADCQTGLLSPPGENELLAGNVIRVAGTPDFRTRMGRQGRDHVQANFSEHRMHEAYVRLYSEMLDG